MGSDKAGKLGKGGIRTINDEGHKQQGERQVFGVEVDDEEGDLTRGVVLGEGVCVGKGEGREERVGVEDGASCGLCNCQQAFNHTSIPMEM